MTVIRPFVDNRTVFYYILNRRNDYEKVKLNGIELIPNNIIVTSRCLDELPLNYKDSKSALLDTRLNYRFLDLRNEKNILMFKVQTCLINAMREFVIKNNFIEIHTPKIISTASESGADVFEIAPVFRTEKSNSYRHATDFTGFDVEISYIETLDELMDFEEDLLITGLTVVKEKYEKEIRNLFNVEVIIPTKPFPRIRFEDLYEISEKEYGYKMNYEDVGDMNTKSEKLVSKYIKEKYGHEFVFMTDFSAKKRAFYHKRENGILQGADLI